MSNNDKIMRSSMFGEMEIILDSALSNTKTFAIDPENGNLYFASSVAYKGDSQLSDIFVYKGGRMSRVVDGNPGTITGLAVDPVEGFIYWTDLADDVESLKKSRTDGGTPEELRSFTRSDLGIYSLYRVFHLR